MNNKFKIARNGVYTIKDSLTAIRFSYTLMPDEIKNEDDKKYYQYHKTEIEKGIENIKVAVKDINKYLEEVKKKYERD